MLSSPRSSLAVPRELGQSALARRPGAQGRTVGGKKSLPCSLGEVSRDGEVMLVSSA